MGTILYSDKDAVTDNPALSFEQGLDHSIDIPNLANFITYKEDYVIVLFDAYGQVSKEGYSYDLSLNTEKPDLEIIPFVFSSVEGIFDI